MEKIAREEAPAVEILKCICGRPAALHILSTLPGGEPLATVGICRVHVEEASGYLASLGLLRYDPYSKVA